MATPNQKWLYEIEPKSSFWNFNFAEIWRYRDLLFLFVKRDIVTYYKQTILGPIWFLIQPLITSVVQYVIFSKIAEIPSDGINYFLFALAGNTLWFYFSDAFNATSNTFRANQNIFGKVYFPRIIMPLSTTISSLLKFGIQFLCFLCVMGYFIINNKATLPNWTIIFTPIILLIMAMISLGLGMIISAMTTKYKDLTFLVSFGVQLLMYITPVVYPSSLVLSKLNPKWHWILQVNPLTNLFEFFRYSFLGSGIFSILGLIISFFTALFLFIFGLLIFNKTEKNFIDTV